MIHHLLDRMPVVEEPEAVVDVATGRLSKDRIMRQPENFAATAETRCG